MGRYPVVDQISQQNRSGSKISGEEQTNSVVYVRSMKASLFGLKPASIKRICPMARALSVFIKIIDFKGLSSGARTNPPRQARKKGANCHTGGRILRALCVGHSGC